MSFPINPVNGQETTINGIVYTYSSSNNAWTRKPRQLFTSGVNAPANPAPGDQWYDTGEDILYQYINDGTGNYWVDIRSGIFGGNSASLGETLIQGNLIPTVNVTYSLGNITNQWKDLYVSSNTIYIGGTPVRISNGNLLVNNAPIIPAATYSNVEVAAYLKSSGGLSSATDAIILPAGTTAQRPTAANGMVRYNSTINGGSLEAYLGGFWVTIASGNYTSGFMIVAGGGGGGARIGAGGGAGGVLLGNVQVTPGTSYTVVVGGGGTAGQPGPYQNPTSTQGGSGNNSTLFGYTALGGGGGGGTDGGSGLAGGSGGGGARNISAPGGAATQTSSGSAVGYGNPGGTGSGSPDRSGGGGGAGAPGATGAASGNGGAGIANPIPGSTVGQNVGGTYYVAGGGGGAGYNGPSQGSGGNGGGGPAGPSTVGTPGTANTGGGGGAGVYDGGSGYTGGAGGSGVVVIYYVSPTQRGSGGTITSTLVGGFTYWLHTFTSTGSFTFIA